MMTKEEMVKEYIGQKITYYEDILETVIESFNQAKENDDALDMAYHNKYMSSFTTLIHALEDIKQKVEEFYGYED